MVKKFTSFLCAVVLSTSFAVGNFASATVILPDSPAYSYTRECSSDLSISGTTATCKSSATGYYNTTTEISVQQYLQKKNSSNKWEDVCSWHDTIYNYSGSVTNKESSLSSGTYRSKNSVYCLCWNCIRNNICLQQRKDNLKITAIVLPALYFKQ